MKLIIYGGIVIRGVVMVNDMLFNMTISKEDDRAERAAKALKELSDAAIANGTSEMTLAEINAEIKAVKR